MYQRQSIYDDMEFDSSVFNPEISNPRPSEISGIDISSVLIIGAIILVIVMAGTYYWKRKKYEDKTIDWLGDSLFYKPELNSIYAYSSFFLTSAIRSNIKPLYPCPRPVSFLRPSHR